MNKEFPKSQEHGIHLIQPGAVNIYCPGISTAGIAEKRMIKDQPGRRVIATTIDEKGLLETRKIITKAGLDDQIILKSEDISKPLPYDDNYFDFIYARLILHYLDKNTLDQALAELYRVLKTDGLLYVVVRSDKDPECKSEKASYNAASGFTTYPYSDNNGQIVKDKYISRYFHNKLSISQHLERAGFEIDAIKQYDEQLYLDYSRNLKSPFVSNVIEVHARK